MDMYVATQSILLRLLHLTCLLKSYGGGGGGGSKPKKKRPPAKKPKPVNHGKEEFVKDSAQNAIKRDGTVRIKERPKTEIDISSFIISINTRVSSLPSYVFMVYSL
jgi:hypothetical protein